MDMQSFDFIIVGSGPSGAVLAKTLSDSGEHSVLLLESGDQEDESPLLQSPDSNLYAHFPEFFWPGESIPQPAVGGRSFALTGGRVAGGGSSVNGEMYVRPTPFVLRQWEKVGGPQWSPENATTHFRTLESFEGARINPSVHGFDGPLHIRQTFPQVPPLVEAFVSSMEEASGLPRIQDYNDPATPIGPFARWQLYQQSTGVRASASVSFLSPEVVTPAGEGVGRRKLTVRYKATALRVLFEHQRATGLTYLVSGRQHTALANRRIILSAGIHSVQLLMLSGIGPREVLEAAGVPVVHENPWVGAALAGDAYAHALFAIPEKEAQVFRQADPHGNFVGGAFLPTPIHGDAGEQRSIQLIPTLAGPDKLSLSILYVDPGSRGSLRIQNDDPLKMMLGDFGFLTDAQDVEVLMATLRTYVAKMGEVLARRNPDYRLLSPAPEILADDEKLRRYILEGFLHTYHDQCSLRMASKAEDGVVDGYGQVYGVSGLSVADASIIPFHTDGNTSACSYLIGHTIAQHLLTESKPI